MNEDKYIGFNKTYNTRTNTHTYSSWLFPICISFSIGDKWIYSEFSIRIFILEFTLSLSEW